jgi:hypothetical protein
MPRVAPGDLSNKEFHLKPGHYGGRLGMAAFLLFFICCWIHALDLLVSALTGMIFHPIEMLSQSDLLTAIIAPPFAAAFLMGALYALALVLQIFTAVVDSFITEVTIRAEKGKVIVTKKRRKLTTHLELLADGIQGVGPSFGSISILYGGTWIPIVWDRFFDDSLRKRIFETVASAGVPLTTGGWVESQSVVAIAK